MNNMTNNTATKSKVDYQIDGIWLIINPLTDGAEYLELVTVSTEEDIQSNLRMYISDVSKDIDGRRWNIGPNELPTVELRKIADDLSAELSDTIEAEKQARWSYKAAQAAHKAWRKAENIKTDLKVSSAFETSSLGTFADLMGKVVLA
jgi:hypothetical protein